MANFRYLWTLFPFVKEYEIDEDYEKLGKSIGEYLLEFVKKCTKIPRNIITTREYYHQTIEDCFYELERLAEQVFPYIESDEELEDALEELYDIADTQIRERKSTIAFNFAWIDCNNMAVGTRTLELAGVENYYDYIIFKNGYESESSSIFLNT